MGVSSLPVQIGAFLAAAAVVWIGSVYLSDSTDAIATRLRLGEALAGLIILAIVEDLPEVVIMVSGSLTHHLGLVTGNLLGGIAAQTLMLAPLDAFGVSRYPLAYRAASMITILEGGLGVILLSMATLSALLPSSLMVFRLDPGALLIVVAWVIGVWLIRKARSGLPWEARRAAPEVPGVVAAREKEMARERRESNTQVLLIFSVSALAILVGGTALEMTSSNIAGAAGLNSILFGGTFLAIVTALPEFSTGLAAARIGNYQTTVSEVFGSNAFLPVLFFPAALISGQAVLPRAGDVEVYLTALGILLTTIYIWGIIFRHEREYWRLGPDSITALIAYVIGVLGLAALTHAL